VSKKAVKDVDKLVEKISEAINERNQGALFDSVPDNAALNSACKDYLCYIGFKVIDPDIPKFHIEKLDDLIFLFYGLCDSNHPELINSYRNLGRDRKIMSLFIKARADASGYGISAAMNECATIIETVFEHEKEFNFTVPVSIGFFGQKKFGWVTDKAIQILNKKKQQTVEERRRDLISRLDEMYEAETGGFGNLDEILKNLG